MEAIFLKAMFGLRVVWTYFHKTTSIDPKKCLIVGVCLALKKACNCSQINLKKVFPHKINIFYSCVDYEKKYIPMIDIT
jgi:hypothetical protein